jgi:hypothetical protein
MILVGRLRLSPSKAIEAYMKLVEVMPNEPAKNDEERNINTKAFKTVFVEVLQETGFDQNTPMLDDDALNGPKM